MMNFGQFQNFTISKYIIITPIDVVQLLAELLSKVHNWSTQGGSPIYVSKSPGATWARNSSSGMPKQANPNEYLKYKT